MEIFKHLHKRNTDFEFPLEFELQFSTYVSISDVSAEASKIFGDNHFKLTTSIGHEAGEDDLFFIEFYELAAPDDDHSAILIARDTEKKWGRDTYLTAVRAVLNDCLTAANAAGQQHAYRSSSCEEPVFSDTPKGWHLQDLGVVNVWEKYGLSGNGIKVCVIDTGVFDHPEIDLYSRENDRPIDLENGLNLIRGEDVNTPVDKLLTKGLRTSPGHGTLVASVIASRGKADDLGDTTDPGRVTGVAPSAKIVPIRAIKSVVNIRMSKIPAAINHAANQVECDIIVMCLGGLLSYKSVTRELRSAAEKGIITLCAAGNCWPKTVFPAKTSIQGLCTAVGAVAYDHKSKFRPWKYSSRGKEVTVSSTGHNVYGAAFDKSRPKQMDLNRFTQGTTLATSTLSGIAALWLEKQYQEFGSRDKFRIFCVENYGSVQLLFNHVCEVSSRVPDSWSREDLSEMGAGVVDAVGIMKVDILTLKPFKFKDSAPDELNVLTDERIRELAYEMKAGALDGMRSEPVSHRSIDEIIEISESIGADLSDEMMWLSREVQVGVRVSNLLSENNTENVKRSKAEMARKPNISEALQNKLRENVFRIANQ